MKVETSNQTERVYTQPESVDTAKKQFKVEESKVEQKPERKSDEMTEKDVQKVRDTVDRMNKELEASNTEIEFKVHESRDSYVNKVSIKVIEKDSNKVIIEIPSEEAIEFSEKMDEISGRLFDHKR